MRFSCKSCQATFQTASGAPAAAAFRCPACNGEMAVVAEVVELWQDRVPTRRYDLDDLRARLDLEREEVARSRATPRSPDQVWFAAVQGRQVGPLSAAGIAGLRTRGQLSAASLVWREGWPSWVAAEAVPELRSILGLPEEQMGRPFPVQPKLPAPPPVEHTYAAAHSPSEDTVPDARLGLSEKTEPAAVIPEGLRAEGDASASSAGEAFAAGASPHSPGSQPPPAPPADEPLAAPPTAEADTATPPISLEPQAVEPVAAQMIEPHAEPAAPASPAIDAAPAPIAESGGAVAAPAAVLAPTHGSAAPAAAHEPAAPAAAHESSTAPAHEPSAPAAAAHESPAAHAASAPAISSATSPVATAEAQASGSNGAAPAALESASAHAPRATDAPASHASHAPPALPLADVAALDQVGSAVLAQAHAPARSEDEITAPGDQPAGEGAAKKIASATAERPSPEAPSASSEPRSDAPADAAPGEGPPPVDPSLSLIDLSAPGPVATDELPKRRSRRPPGQQQWFSGIEEPREPAIAPRNVAVLGVLLAMAVLALFLLMRGH